MADQGQALAMLVARQQAELHNFLDKQNAALLERIAHSFPCKEGYANWKEQAVSLKISEKAVSHNSRTTHDKLTDVVTCDPSVSAALCETQEVNERDETSHALPEVEVSPLRIKKGKSERSVLDRSKSLLESLFMMHMQKESLTPVLDMVIGIVILINTVVLVAFYEWQGHLSGIAVGLNESDGSWKYAESAFHVIEHVFNIVYIIELFLRARLSGLIYFKQLLSTFDVFLVLISSIDLYIVQNLPHAPDVDMAVLRTIRLIRVFKVCRALRVFRTLALFRTLRVLVKTIYSCTRSLTTSMLLLSIMMLVPGITLCQLLQEFIIDDTQDLHWRRWAWQHYGSALRSCYTFFEIVLAGCWPNYVRPLIEQVNEWYALFFVFYICLVVFAVTRIITAIFLKETMDMAMSDTEMVNSEQTLKRNAYLDRVHRYFQEADADGNGSLTQDEFASLLLNEEVKAWFLVLGLEAHEINTLFHLLENGDGMVTIDDFINGVNLLKGQSRNYDVIKIQREIQKVHGELQFLVTGIADLAKTSSRHTDCVTSAAKMIHGIS
eukprot:TRINITY_DN27771_c0_g1_i1.p1 TRINITY_DN27771_c0_g1~~TRINITY_DN27771_c0_g1_i1.p1  ORF type:complete len:600 (-),score=84.79 TRINITY_DN27771_c0_g1_i1:76-1728(-)